MDDTGATTASTTTGNEDAKSKSGRLSINAIPATQRALDRLMSKEGVSLTEALRRLVSYGAHIDAALQEGAEVINRRTSNGEQEKLVILT